MIIGGSAAPEGMIRAFDDRHGLHVLHAWGMTETTPARDRVQPEQPPGRGARGRTVQDQGHPGHAGGRLSRSGRAATRASSPGTGSRMGELEVRGSVGLRGLLQHRRGRRQVHRGRLVQDRRHRHHRAERLRRDPGPDQGPHKERRRVDILGRPRERPDGPRRRRRGRRHRHPAARGGANGPSGVVVLKEGEEATEEDLLDHLATNLPKWSLPDAIEFVGRDTAHRHGQGA